MLRLRQVSAGYEEIKILFSVDLEIKEGQIVAIVGSNGAGKTTLLRTISGLIRCSEGAIEFLNVAIHSLAPYQIAAMGIAHVPEGRQLFARLTVLDNLYLGCHAKVYSPTELSRRLDFVYSLFPILKERSHQKAGTLSGGEQQMLAIGRALMMDPKLLMLDEPSLGIAPKLVSQIFESIKRINEMGTTVLLVEQNVVESLEISHYAYILQSGQIITKGTGQELLKTDLIRKSFLGM
ncbi:MAG: ABC transporter ATP-binding protein [Bacillota bacterium]